MSKRSAQTIYINTHFKKMAWSPTCLQWDGYLDVCKNKKRPQGGATQKYKEV